MSSEQNSPEIGSPQTMGALMQATRASILRASSTDFSTTSPKGKAEMSGELLTVGNGAGAHGAIATREVSPAVLKAFDLPPQAATLAHSLAPLLVWGDKSLFSAHGYEGVAITDVRVRAGASRADLEQRLGEVERVCMPCGANFAAKKLAELRALTAHRARDGIDVDVMATAYTVRLSEYPTDVVNAACDAWTNANPFWPTWAELKDECDKRMRGRKQIRDALRKALQ
jgi:hypothetical protein